MKIQIAQWSAWVNGVDSVEGLRQWASSPLNDFPDLTFPVPEFVPKASRRRLSSLAKMVLSQAGKLDRFHLHPSVFCTRHGDLPKTVSLIADVARGECLSPTQFALSVHNAISGQFGIFANNVKASTLISAGRDSFHMGLIDASLRLQQSDEEQLLFVYADMPLPAPYMEYADEAQLPHCIAFRLVKCPKYIGNTLSLSNKTSVKKSENPSSLPQSLQFLQHFLTDQQSFTIVGNRSWEWQRG